MTNRIPTREQTEWQEFSPSEPEDSTTESWFAALMQTGYRSSLDVTDPE